MIEVMGWERGHGTEREVTAVPRLPDDQRVPVGGDRLGLQ